MKLVSEIEKWQGLFPFCTHSRLLRDLGDGRRHYAVYFGLNVGPFFVGDLVEYEVRQTSRSLHLVSINGADLHYSDHIEYTFRVQDAEEGGSEVEVALKLHARNRMYLTIWQSLESQLVEHMVAALTKRLQDKIDNGPISKSVRNMCALRHLDAAVYQ
jgi:ribosome-associated toxin RatA of RatAB toxin-antitoxin module